MANPEHVEIVRAGRAAIEQWVKRQPRLDSDHCLDLSRAKLGGIRLGGADLRYANLKEVDLRWAYFNGANLRGALLDETELQGAKLIATDFRSSILRNVDLTRATLKSADFGRACLQHVEFNKSYLRNAKFQAAYLEDCKFNAATLNCARFQRARLVRVELRDSYLRRTHIKYADLYRTDFTNADCTGAQFQHAILNTVQFLRARLRSANLSGATLYAVQIDEWDIKDVLCTYFYAGYFEDLKFRKKRVPRIGFLAHREFEDRFKSRPIIELMFENGMPALGPAALDLAIEQANLQKPAAGLKLLDITARGGIPRAIVEITEKVSKEDALVLVTVYYDQKLQQMQREIKDLREDKRSLLQIATQRMLLPALETGLKRTSKPGRKSKYTPEKIKNMRASFAKHLQEEKGVKYAWDCVAEEHHIKSGKAAEMAVRRHQKENK